MARTRKTGFGIEPPKETCQDKNCPYHGTLKIRGKQFTGTVVSDRMQNSAIVEWTGWRHIPKYERYKKIKTRVSVHNPPCVSAKEGDLVKIGECRSLSKTKNFVVLKVLGKEEHYALEKESLEEGKHKEKAREAANQDAVKKQKPEEKPEKEAKKTEPAEEDGEEDASQ